MEAIQENIQYVGEHLLPGQAGSFFIFLGFVASLLAATAYFFATQKRSTDQYTSWRRIGRIGFLLHSASIFALVGILFYMLLNQYFEYQYVQLHASADLPRKYVFSAFWEGQEGSFILWLFWHAVLGLVLMRTAKSYEAPVLSILALIQALIFTMILGIYLPLGETTYKIGSNPMLLLRDVLDLPIFANADYVSLIKGNGLNPLLQNYWMTIHPPTLFLGFASTAVPFCYAIAGLWLGGHKDWLRPVMPWALFSGFILGIGILMGGAWAYEALSFGGYWAWDPVENASLVPWIVLVAGIHTNMIARSTGHSIRSTYIFYLLSFIFIVYSTALTRSGILGDTSVHAFTEMGLETQLALFITLFTALGSILFLKSYKAIPAPKKEESVGSKEFWMFIGSLVLLFSAILITFTTSIPLYKKVAELFSIELNITSPLEPVDHYNKYQLWIGVFIGLLSGAAQYLRYREFNWKKHQSKFFKHTGISLAITGLITLLSSMWINIVSWQYGLLLFAGIFTFVSNLDYFINFIRGNVKLAGSVLSHAGFGIMVIGILASGLNKRHISSNPMVQRNLIPEEYLAKNVMLIEGKPMFMKGFEVTYVGDTLVDLTRTYEIEFKKLDENGQPAEKFKVFPNILYQKDFSDIAAPNPDTKRYLHKDIFTHIADIPASEKSLELRQEMEDSLDYRLYEAQPFEQFVIADTIRARDTFAIWTFNAIVNGIVRNPTHPEYKAQAGDLPIGVNLAVRGRRFGNDSIYYVQPMIVLRGNLLYNYPVQINDLNLKVKLDDSILDNVFSPEDELEYSEFKLKEGQTITYNGKIVGFAGFDKNVDHPQYAAQDGDVAVSAVLKIDDPETGSSYYAKPVYLIRGNRPFNLKDQLIDLGLHFRFTGIDPSTGLITLNIAQSESIYLKIPLYIAANARRNDYIIFEAIEFPGINLFWVGSLTMLFGMAFSIWHRLKGPKTT